VQETIDVTPFEVMTGWKHVSFAETFKSTTGEPDISAQVVSLTMTLRTIKDVRAPHQQQAKKEMASCYKKKQHEIALKLNTRCYCITLQ
jgi:hypothetical protein